MHSPLIRFASLLLAMLMLLSLTACGTGDTIDDTQASTTDAQSEAVTDDPN